MRAETEKLLGMELRFLAIRTRDRLKLTQKEMGVRLMMRESSYSDIETGRTTCGALTEALLLKMQDEPGEFLSEVADKFAERYEQENQAI